MKRYIFSFLLSALFLCTTIFGVSNAKYYLTIFTKEDVAKYWLVKQLYLQDGAKKDAIESKINPLLASMKLKRIINKFDLDEINLAFAYVQMDKSGPIDGHWFAFENSGTFLPQSNPTAWGAFPGIPVLVDAQSQAVRQVLTKPAFSRELYDLNPDHTPEIAIQLPDFESIDSMSHEDQEVVAHGQKVVFPYFNFEPELKQITIESLEKALKMMREKRLEEIVRNTKEIVRNMELKILSEPPVIIPSFPSFYTDGRMWGGNASHYDTYRDGGSAKERLGKLFELERALDQIELDSLRDQIELDSLSDFNPAWFLSLDVD